VPVIPNARILDGPVSAFPKDSSNWLTEVVLAVGAVLVGRVLSVYQFVPLSNRFAEKISFR
jgi:hypothetical protein